MKDIFSVEGKVTVVSGAGTGIGAAIAREFAVRGAPVLIFSRNAEHLEPTRDAIRKAGGKCEMTVCDVRQPDQINAMINETVKHFGRLDVFVNNAAGLFSSNSLELSPNGWKVLIDIDLNGVFYCSQAAARQFVAQKSGGSIVNISSGAAYGSPGSVNYGAAKGGMHSMTKSLASEWGPLGIRTNCVVAGMVVTEGARQTWATSEAIIKSRAAGVALGRPAEPEEIAYPCMFLSSDAGSYCNGVIMDVDGGRAMRPD